MLLGIVIKNSEDRFLILKRNAKNMVDHGLISGEIDGCDISSNIKKVLNSEICFDFSDGVEFKTLMEGGDCDGEYLILSCEKDFTVDETKSVKNFQMMWCTFNKIKKLHKDGRLNDDQFIILSKAYFTMVNKDTSNAMKVNHRELKYKKLSERNDFDMYVEHYTDKRLFLRLVHRRKIKPCGRECREYGFLIAQEFSDHSSFENFPDLMDDKEFLLEIARTSRNPATCRIYFYDYVNPCLKRDKVFRLSFLKQLYLNDNVFTLEDINIIVEYLEMQKENEIILSSLEFRKVFEKRLESLNCQQLEYHCSGDGKELRKFKIKANELKALNENKKRGLTEIVNTFKVGEKKRIEEFEPETYYEFLCKQAFSK